MEVYDLARFDNEMNDIPGVNEKNIYHWTVGQRKILDSIDRLSIKTKGTHVDQIDRDIDILKKRANAYKDSYVEAKNERYDEIFSVDEKIKRIMNEIDDIENERSTLIENMRMRGEGDAVIGYYTKKDYEDSLIKRDESKKSVIVNKGNVANDNVAVKDDKKKNAYINIGIILIIEILIATQSYAIILNNYNPVEVFSRYVMVLFVGVFMSYMFSKGENYLMGFISLLLYIFIIVASIFLDNKGNVVSNPWAPGKVTVIGLLLFFISWVLSNNYLKNKTITEGGEALQIAVNEPEIKINKGNEQMSYSPILGYDYKLKEKKKEFEALKSNFKDVADYQKGMKEDLFSLISYLKKKKEERELLASEIDNIINNVYSYLCHYCNEYKILLSESKHIMFPEKIQVMEYYGLKNIY
jgi:predicted  nucleic acid-binding Zn-ribbon protein